MYTMLNHLYKNTAAIAIAAFIVLSVGLTATNKGPTEVAANTPTSLITVTAGTNSGKTWQAIGAFSQVSNSGSTLYGFSSGNITTGTTSMTLKKQGTATSRGWFANTSANSLYGRIVSVAMTQTANVAMSTYFHTSAITNLTTPAGTALSPVVTGSGPYVFTWTPGVGVNYQYFFIRNGGNVANAAVTQIVVSYVPVITSIAVTTPATTTTFDIGQTYDNSGMVVTGTYENTVTSAETGFTTNYDAYAFVSGDTGVKTVNISFTELGITKTTSYTITIRTQLQTDTMSATNFKNYITGLGTGALCGAGGVANRTSMINQYQALTPGAKAVFSTDSTMAAAKATYNYINNFYGLGVPASAANIPSVSAASDSAGFLILIVTIIGLTSIAGYFFFSRKHENN